MIVHMKQLIQFIIDYTKNTLILDSEGDEKIVFRTGYSTMKYIFSVIIALDDINERLTS